MKRAFLSVLLAFLLASPAWAWEAPPAGKKPEEVRTLEVLWEGSTDLDMLRQVRLDLARAKEGEYKTLRVFLLSPGGPVITSLEIARLVRQASTETLTIEIQAVGLCASGCTFVLAAGTPGNRYISRWALFLIHAPQRGSFMAAPECVSFNKEPKDVNERADNAVLLLMRDMYVWLTAKPATEVEKWLSCGFELVGSGEEAVKLGVADKLSD